MDNWEPLELENDKLETVRTVVRDIARVMPEPAGLGAILDRAVLHAYLEQSGYEETNNTSDLLSQAVEQGAVSSHITGPVLFGGTTQLGWTIEHLVEGADSERVCSSVDAPLIDYLRMTASDCNYDLVYGKIGLGVYGLERGDAKIVSQVISTLEQTANTLPTGISWHTPPDLLVEWQRKLAPEGYWNVGMAHGVPGVIAFLARCVRHNVEAVRAQALIEPAVQWLLSVPHSDGYAGWVPCDEAPTRRVAWCYGDLGVSVALLSAALACRRGDWTNEAVRIALSTTSHDDHHLMRDASLCHGASGALHLYMRLWNATGLQEFKSAAHLWLDRTLAVRTDQAHAGYPYHDGHSLKADDTLLCGASGVALALLAATTPVEPSWDRLLLVDF